MFQMLTGPGGYGFPKENVCILLNQDADTARFRQAFDAALVERARPGDEVVVYFAGHGSQTRDLSGDEPDEWDETLLLHDSRSNGLPDLLDDTFNAMLSRLYQKTENVVVILDSCNSGSATRDGVLQARFEPPQAEASTRHPVAGDDGTGDGAGQWEPTGMPGMVVMSAAADGTPALEKDGAGVFTSALLQALGESNSRPLTYAQLARQVPPLIAAASGQLPSFQGALEKQIFGGGHRQRPQGWEVTAVDGADVTLQGIALPGWSSGAEVRLYDGAATLVDSRDPAKSKGVLKLDSVTGLVAHGRRLNPPKTGAPQLRAGDVAVLLRPGDDALRLKVRFRPEREAGGVSLERAQSIRAALQASELTRNVVEPVQTGAVFELVTNLAGRLQLIGPEGTIRTTFTADRSAEPSQIAKNLWQHARQQGLLQLTGEAGKDFENNATLQVQLIPADRQKPCATGNWIQSRPNHEQHLPLCYRWQVKVTVADSAPVPLLVGGVVLFSDGGLYGFPSDGSIQRIEPGKSFTFKDVGVSTPPLEMPEHVMVFGTRESQPVRWSLLTDPAATRSVAATGAKDGGEDSSLARALAGFLMADAKGGMFEADSDETLTWTSSHLPFRVEANSQFTVPAPGATVASTSTILKREYTVPHFDIRPYRPDDPKSALAQVLEKEYWLANYATRDGVPYHQHDWSAGTDTGNLKRGIDCSRAIWFAFTRAGLPFNRGDRYLPTAEMIGPKSPMTQQFDSCTDDPALQLGDVLVYRDEARHLGHVVMVIDPRKRIAWGSHGWDGNVLEHPGGEAGIADTGVEYQRIKYKKDWERWDLRAMKRVACWRYRRFVEEGKKPGGQPGAKALEDACDVKRCKE